MDFTDIDVQLRVLHQLDLLKAITDVSYLVEDVDKRDRIITELCTFARILERSED